MPYPGQGYYYPQQPTMAQPNNGQITAMPPAAQPYIPPQMAPIAQAASQPSPSRQNNMILDWVQGPEAASAYYVDPGRGAILMDINRRTFYLTSRGEDGIPRPMQAFDYYQRNTQTEQPQQERTDNSAISNLDSRLKVIEDSLGLNSTSSSVQMLPSAAKNGTEEKK